MKFENEVRKQLKNTGLYRDRKDVLEHLFRDSGNGYEWIDGELVDTRDDKYTGRMFEMNKGIHPMSEEHSYLLNFPDDIKDDWLDGIYELACYLDVDTTLTGENKRIVKMALKKTIDMFYSRGSSPIERLIVIMIRMRSPGGVFLHEMQSELHEQGIPNDLVRGVVNKLCNDGVVMRNDMPKSSGIGTIARFTIADR